MGSISSEYRREDGFVRSFRDLQRQRFWQMNVRSVNRGGQDGVSIVDGAVCAFHRPRVGVRVPFDALDLDANSSEFALHRRSSWARLPESRGTESRSPPRRNSQTLAYGLLRLW